MVRDWLSTLWLWLSTGFRAAPVLSTCSLIIGLGYAVQAPAQAYAVKLLIDGIAHHDSGPMIWAVVLTAGAVVFRFGIGMSASAVQDTSIDRVHDYVHADLIRLTTGIPSIVHHERPDIADRIELLHKRSRDLANNVNSLFAIVTAFINAAVVLLLLVSVDPLLVLLPLVGLVRIWASYVDGKLRFGAADRVTWHRRLADRLTQIAKSPTNAVEVRVFGLQHVLLDRIDQQLTRVQDERLAATRKGMYYELGARMVFGAAFLTAIVLVAIATRHGSISPGDLALLIVLGSRIDEAAGGIASAMRKSGESVGLFSRYNWLKHYAREVSCSLASTITPVPTQLTHGIELRDVAFAYPGSDTPVLTNINLTLPAGSTIALVGENGAGKSTLVKLLARLYDPTHGTILVDGQDLRDISPESWRLRTSAAFQDFVNFEFTAAGSVGIGDLPRMGDLSTVRAALEQGDAVDIIDGLPNGIETQLGKRFSDGIDLSVGQWQRLALARGFMRTAGNPEQEPLLLLLDEPTAALDPDSEHALYDRFAAAAVRSGSRIGTITVLVSHRFSTVRMADLIVVLHHGRIIEVGTHQELITTNGLYAELFELQARAYR